jgi:very-short-patch-repair endonuclease
MRTLYTSRLVPRARELRREQTPAERRLWFCFLRGCDIKFRRQVPLLGYILDFYAPSLKLCIELDGQSHETTEAQRYDAARTETLTAAGITVLRFSNEDVSYRFSAVCTAIEQACHPLASP